MRFPTARDPLLSLFQAAAAFVARQRGAAGLKQAADRLVAGGAGDANPTPAVGDGCAPLGLALLRATLSGDAALVATLHDRLAFSGCDPLWAETLLDYARRLGPDGRPTPVPYRRYRALSDFVLPAPRAAMRVALVSDWGTGTRSAEQTATLIATQHPDAVIHLGDIYYAATDAECARHFLEPMRAALPATPLFTLCGNHDTYGGGQGYYRLLDRIGQPASYFCLRSPDRSWQILAADTGLHDDNPLDEADALTFLDPAEEAWHADKLRGFGGRTVLLSHHQPFSGFARLGPAGNRDPTNPELMRSFARLAAAGPVCAWFWGHEHVLRLYAPYRGIAAGRTIGNGAIPFAAALDRPLAGLRDPPALAATPPVDLIDGAYAHGFALLELGPGGIEASYWIVSRPDAPIHRERLGEPQGAAV